MEDKVLQCSLVSCQRDIMGDLESFRIKDETGHTKTVTVEQVEDALKKGLVEVKGLGLTNRGNVKVTKRRGIKKPNDPRRRKLEKIEKDIMRLEAKGAPSETIIKKRRELGELLRDDGYLKVYEAIRRSIEKNK